MQRSAVRQQACAGPQSLCCAASMPGSMAMPETIFLQAWWRQAFQPGGTDASFSQQACHAFYMPPLQRFSIYYQVPVPANSGQIAWHQNCISRHGHAFSTYSAVSISVISPRSQVFKNSVSKKAKRHGRNFPKLRPSPKHHQVKRSLVEGVFRVYQTHWSRL